MMLVSSPTTLHHQARDLVEVVRVDEFVFARVDEELDFVLIVLNENFELKEEARLKNGESDKREMSTLAQKIWWRLTWEEDERCRNMVMRYFGMVDTEKTLMTSDNKDDDANAGTVSREPDQEERKSCRILAAR